MTIQKLLYPLLVGVGSSTDNFIVGLTVGLKKSEYNKSFLKFNLVISLANAIGAYVASTIGLSVLGITFAGNEEVTREYSSLLAGIAFYYLAINEYLQSNQQQEEQQGDQELSSKDQFSIQETLQLALPMTLNNLAGGIASGVSGISPWISFVMAFLCSFGMMQIGYILAVNFHIQWIESHANAFAMAAFGFLANLQIFDYLGIE